MRSPRLRIKRLSLVSASALVTAFGATAASAQPQPPTPPTRGELEGTLRPQPRDERARLDVEGELERRPCALERPEYAAIRFTLTGAEFADLRGLGQADLRPAYADYVGREQPLSVICRIRDRAAAILRDAGYIAAVEVPEQRIENGVVQFRVLMAKLVGLRVRGDAGRNERLIARYLEPLTTQEVFNTRVAERYLLLAGDLPGTNVRLALRPAGTVPGEVVGEVTIVRLPGIIDLNLQNYGSESVGRGGALLRAQVYGLTGLGDRTTLAFYSTADFVEQRTLQLAHDFRVGGEGLQIGGQFTYSWAEPQLFDPALNIESRTLYATLEASYPFVRTLRSTVRGTVGVDLVDQEVDFADLPFSEDKLRILFARLGFETVAPRRAREPIDPLGPRWRLEAGLEVRQGLPGLGASDGCNADFSDCTAPGTVPPSRLEGRPDATVLRAEANGELRFLPNVSFYLGGMAQMATAPLFAFEEFSAGNYTVGRGYDPATIAGDHGAGVQAELRFGRLAPQSEDDLALQPYLFFDAAWVDNEDQSALVGFGDELHSAGGGIRAIWGNRAQADLTFAVPLTRAGFLAETPDPRLLVSFTTRLWPWRSR
ncbi:MAG: ShlB/FhaC/HecB family hemolysin secretion/activation protein [Allosphingosinicella sp.]|uniref:ShlB/FhaC/HecB family hemolysin secretion/activation protein n=1 Tax=Allosphingosinicella sp. TaxID=2823234 RepID=UPI00392C8D59